MKREERQVGWRGEVTRYFVDRGMGGREGTGDQRAGGRNVAGKEPRAITCFSAGGAWLDRDRRLSGEATSPRGSIGRAEILRPSGASSGEPVVGVKKEPDTRLN